MNPIIRNILAFIAGFVLGSIVNVSLINIGPSIIPPPADADITTMEGLKASMHLFKPINFLFPFLAHALGTLVGAWICALLAVGPKMKLAMGLGFFFLVAGIANVILLPSLLWYTIVDLVFAYIPMAYLGGKLAIKR